MSAPARVSIEASAGTANGARADSEYDAIIIGSGFGGAMCAHELVSAGWRVLMIERGQRVARGPRNWAPDQAMELAAAWDPHAWDRDGPLAKPIGAFRCVGGPSVFYGGASPRCRVRDFQPEPGIVEDSGAQWPFGYDVLESWYGQAERLIGVIGDDAADPTAPPRSTPARRGPPLSSTSHRIGAAARALGLTPSVLPLAINWNGDHGRASCVACTTCDAFACAIGAKNDIATAVLPGLIRRGLTLIESTVVVRLRADGRRISRVDCVDARSGARSSFRGRHVVLAAGALATPHLALASGLDRLNPAGHLIGRFLMRHCNGLVYGLFPDPPNPELRFHKQLAFFDAYFGWPGVPGPSGKLGCLQQVHAPPAGLAASRLPRFLRGIVPPLLNRTTGLLVIAEDQPRISNRIGIDVRRSDVHGLPRAIVTHRHTPRDLQARRALARIARSILREAGAVATAMMPIDTFSHALGTMRMGMAGSRAPVDPDGRFRGVENLWVSDGSVFPTSAAVNPSLTIAANALRIGRRIVEISGGPTRTVHDEAESCAPSIIRIAGRRDRPLRSGHRTIQR